MNANFEKYARKQLSGHEVDVDTNALWASIQPQVSAPAAGNRKTLWVFLLGLLLGLTVFGVFYANRDTQNLTVGQSENNFNIKNDVASTTAITTEKDIEKQVSQQLQTEANSSATVVENTALKTNANTSATTIADSNSSNKTIKEAKKGQQTISNKIVSTPESKSNSILGNDVTFVTDPVERTVQNTQSGNSKQTDKASVFSPMKQDASAAVVEINENRLMAVNSIPTLLPEQLHSDKEIPVGFLDAYKTISGKPLVENKKRPRRGSMLRNLKFGLGLYTGVSSSAADLELNNPDAEEYLILRANSEKQLESLHFGFSAIVEAENNLYLRSGAEYTRIASLFSRAAEDTVMDSVPGIVEIQINQVTGDTLEIEGMVLRTTVTSYTKKSYNYFHQVDIPLILGYNFGDDDWRIGVEAGIYANIYMKRKGQISLADGEFYDIAEDKNEWYKSNIGISPFLGINAAYNVSENIQVHFSPNFRFKSIYSTDASLIKERHASLGVHAGVRYFFD